NITWKEKLEILLQIAKGLKAIHNANFTHRDLHSGNILYKKRQDAPWLIADFGLTQATNNIPSANNEIYGVIPYMAPEILKDASFSKASDIY
ncbi:676_t:CDS:2, partial [Funneliformis geosporum]